MARIRSIKPEFFRHHRLFLAEKSKKLPLRVAFAGLWTACDREGRFKWIPEDLKLDCLPYDNLDFSKVLESLEEFGFISRYAVNGTTYGFIPSWPNHQHINLREAQSALPEPNEENLISKCMHVHARVEGKGKEGKGKDREVHVRALSPPDDFPVGAELKEWASKNAPGLDVEAETEKFLDHHRSKGNKFTDWVAAWRKWMRNAAEWGHARGNGAGKGKSDVWERLERKADEEEKRAAKQSSH